MDTYKGLYARLIGYAALAALVGDRVYPLVLPQGKPRPAITYQLITPVPSDEMRSKGVIERSRWQVSVWGTTYLEAKSVAEQVVACLDGFTGLLGAGITTKGIVMVDQVEMSDPTGDGSGATRCHIATDFIVWT